MYATSITQRNVLKATVPDRMVWLPKPAWVIAAVHLSKALKGDKQSARPCCSLQKLLLIKKVNDLNTLHLYPAQTRKRTKKELPNSYIKLLKYRHRLFDFYSKRGLGPDQSHYKQSWAQFCCKMWGDSWVWNRSSDVLCTPIPNLIYRGVLRATLITLCPCRWCTCWYT